MGFRLVPTLMTLSDPERRNSPYFAFFTEFDCFAGPVLAQYITVVEYRLIMSVVSTPSSSLPLLAITNPPWSAISLR